MEVFGVAANVMAAVSLTLQLADNIENIKEFWTDMKAAPKEVENILRELELLKGIIEGLRRALTMKHEHGPDPAQVASVLVALVECQRHVDNATDFSSDLQRAMGKRRLMTAFKTTLKKVKIAQFERHVEQAKTTLLLAISVATFLLHEACSERVRLQFCDLRSDIKMKFSVELTPPPEKINPEPIARDSVDHRTVVSTHRQISISDILLWLLQLPLDSPHRQYLKSTGNLVGRISWRFSSTVLQQSYDTNVVKQSMAISIHIPILHRAFTLGCRKALGQWTHTFRTSRIVPDNSPIFKVCATEDASSVLRLFESGLASPFDQTNSGITLLHAAAAGYSSGIYKFLQDSGVEYAIYDHPQYGKLAPVEVTQDITIFVDGRHQTVQQWLSIDGSDDSRVFHPEYNYQNVVNIWNSVMETEEQMSDEVILTLLQGPLRIPRQSSSTSAITKRPATYKCSSPLLLLCFYFLFQQDPYGRKIISGTLHSRYLREPIPFHEYTRNYWDAEHWKRMLPNCKNLDFRALAERQQEKFTGFTWSRSMDSGRGKWTKKKVATFNFCGDEEWVVRIGPLEEFQVMFEFEDEDCGVDSLVEDDHCETGMSKKLQSAPFLTSSNSNDLPCLHLIWRGSLMEKRLSESWLRGLLVLFFFLAFLHYISCP